MAEVHGYCDERYEAVRAQFARHFDEGLEVGASVCVTKDGETVVDLWAGDADSDGRPWEEHTICNVWSTTKTMAAIVLLMLSDRGLLDLDAPVAQYWPEFGANGKEGVLVRHVLAHTAGLPGWSPAIAVTDLYDLDVSARNFEAQAPWWEPGTRSGYHAISQGHLEAEIVRRVTGASIGTFFRNEVAGPLGAEFHIGLPESEEHNVGELFPPDVTSIGEAVGSNVESVAVRALSSCPLNGSEPNTREWRAAEIPAAGGQGNSRGVARVHAAIANGGTVDGVTLMSEDTVNRIFEEQIENVDLVLGAKMRLGIGFGLMNETVPLSANPRSCFWGGWGGSIAVIDVDSGLSMSYVMNRMAPELMGDLRGGTLAMLALMAGA